MAGDQGMEGQQIGRDEGSEQRHRGGRTGLDRSRKKREQGARSERR